MKHFILYVADGAISSCGPFDSENEALQYASDDLASGDESLRVYHLTPEQKLIELSASDLDSTKQKDEVEKF